MSQNTSCKILKGILMQELVKIVQDTVPQSDHMTATTQCWQSKRNCNVQGREKTFFVRIKKKAFFQANHGFLFSSGWLPKKF
jgi:hypothetical protein